MPVNAQSLPLEVIPAPILVLDDDGRILQWSAAAAELFSLTTADLSRPATLLVPRATLPNWHLALAEARQHGEWRGELGLQSVKGAELRVEVHFAIGQEGWILGLTNLTPRLRHESAARRVWQRRAVERLATAAAAELRSASASSAAAVRQFDFLTLADETETGDLPVGHSVLLVGGGALARECLRLLLESRGFAVQTASDGYEAIEQLESSRCGIQAAIVDSDLPGWGAAAAITALRRREAFLPVVVLGTLEEKRIEEKIQAVVPKPFRLDDVLWGIAECRRTVA